MTDRRRGCRWGLAAVLALVACKAAKVPPSIWPPEDFELSVEELQIEATAVRVLRRVRFCADGIVLYCTSSRSVADAATGTALPVFDRLAIYRLVPTNLRGLARRLHKLGITEIEGLQGEPKDGDGSAIGLVWQAFHQRKVVSARGRVHGPMAEILGVVMAHLPPGETLMVGGLADRPVLSVVRGVPVPGLSAPGALAALRDLMAERPNDVALVLDAYALACDQGQRTIAAELLERWRALNAASPPAGAFSDAETRLDAAVLERLLPPAN